MNVSFKNTFAPDKKPKKVINNGNKRDKRAATHPFVLKHFDLQADRNGMLRCPFHADDKASLKVYPSTNILNCCGKNGDGIQFIEFYKKIIRHEAILKAQTLIGLLPVVKPQSNIEKPEPTGPQERTGILTKIFEGFKSGLSHPVGVKPKEYLKKRNLNPFPVGSGLQLGVVPPGRPSGTATSVG